MDFKDAETIYKTALVYTASPQRLIFVLYNKLIVELKKAMAKYRTSKAEAMFSLNHASKVLNELLNIFLTTPDPTYQDMYFSHDPIAVKISKMFASGEIDPRQLNDMIAHMTDYRDAWQKALKIRDRRFPLQKKTRPLNINLTTGKPEEETSEETVNQE